MAVPENGVTAGTAKGVRRRPYVVDKGRDPCRAAARHRRGFPTSLIQRTSAATLVLDPVTPAVDRSAAVRRRRDVPAPLGPASPTSVVPRARPYPSDAPYASP